MRCRRLPFRTGAWALILCLCLCAPGLTEEAPAYVRNEWNYAEGSMDVFDGIPDYATGRLMEIRRSGRLRVVTEPYYPPQEFIDPTKSGQERYVGADMELARRIAERMDVELVIVPRSFSDVLTTISAGDYDLAISALAFTTGRSMTMELSKGYYFTDEEAATGLLIRQENAETIRSVEDLNGLDIVAQSGSIQESVGAEHITAYREFRRLSTVQDVYDQVMSGEAAAGLVDIGAARLYIQGNPDCGLAIVDGVAFSLREEFLGDRIAAPKGELSLIYFVNGVIDEVLEKGLYDKWYAEYSEYAERIGS